jgi:hypothetical protein
MYRSLFFVFTLLSAPVYADDSLFLPNPKLSPGEANPNVTVEQLCTSGYSKSVRNVTEKTKEEVCNSYGIVCTGKTHEVDHIIPLVIGGTNSPLNLFPQSYQTCPYNAWVKDRLEKFMHHSVCKVLKENGAEAATHILHVYQHEMASNWVEAYNRYIIQTGRVKNDKSAKRCLTSSGTPVE